MNEEDHVESELRRKVQSFDYETLKTVGLEVDKVYPSRNYSMYIQAALRELISLGNNSPSLDQLVAKTLEIGEKKTEAWLKLGYDDG